MFGNRLIRLSLNNCTKHLYYFDITQKLFLSNQRVLFQSADLKEPKVETDKSTDKVISKLCENFQDKLKKQEEIYYVPREKSRHLYTYANSREVKEDTTIDAKFKHLINENKVSEAVELLKRYADDENRYPSRQFFVILATLCARKGDKESIYVIRNICSVCFPTECDYQMKFRHYEAEALWQSGSCDEALDLFYNLYVHYPLQRRKLTNLTNFCFQHIIGNNLNQHFPKLLEFVDLVIKLNDFTPAANVWRLAFCSDNFFIQQLSEQLLELHPTLPKYLHLKIKSIIKTAKENVDKDLFQRLMNVVLRFRWTEFYTEIFGEYINYLCETGDVMGIEESLKYIKEFSIIIPAKTMEKSMLLLKEKDRTSINFKAIYDRLPFYKK